MKSGGARHRLSVLGWVRRSRGLWQVLPVGDFRAIVERERARADRNNHQFSLVLFDVRPDNGHGDATDVLARVVTGRVRFTDEVGWYDRNHIGVILPDTSEAGAWVVATAIRDTVALTCAPPNCVVYTYPAGDGPDESSHDGRRTGVGVGSTFPGAGPTSAWPVPVAQGRRSSDRAFRAAAPNNGNGCRTLTPIFVEPTPWWKRAIDIIGALIGIIIFSPVMLITAAAVKLTSNGPLIFKQERAGLGGKPFHFYKFRSMVVNAEAMKKDLLDRNERTGPVFKLHDDPRVTRVGRFIRKWSIDELPQLFNVLKGDMSLVGPRPPTFDEVAQYAYWHENRLRVKPGITCIWQVKARHLSDFDNWVRLDINYLRMRSFLLDLKLLLRTVPAVLLRRGAC